MEQICESLMATTLVIVCGWLLSVSLMAIGFGKIKMSDSLSVTIMTTISVVTIPLIYFSCKQFGLPAPAMWVFIGYVVTVFIGFLRAMMV